MSGFTAEPINAKHAELIAAMVARGYPRTAAWFATQFQAEQAGLANVETKRSPSAPGPEAGADGCGDGDIDG